MGGFLDPWILGSVRPPPRRSLCLSFIPVGIYRAPFRTTKSSRRGIYKVLASEMSREHRLMKGPFCHPAGLSPASCPVSTAAEDSFSAAVVTIAFFRAGLSGGSTHLSPQRTPFYGWLMANRSVPGSPESRFRGRDTTRSLAGRLISGSAGLMCSLRERRRSC